MSDLPPDLPRLVVFTDLDGTLLDHDSYAWAPARPALAALAARGAALVLASSKTAGEIAALHAELGLGDTPAIVENGAGVFRPKQTDQPGRDYDALRRALASVPDEYRKHFIGFGDMSVDEVAQATGLSPQAAALAKARAFSEPGLWTGSDADLAAFTGGLAADGVAARRGGRFLALSFGATKADRMAEIAAELGAEITLALGDAPNDIEMLEAADHGVIVRNDHGPGIAPLAGEAAGRITRTEAPGPAGWNAAVLDFLATLTNREAQSRHG